MKKHNTLKQAILLEQKTQLKQAPKLSKQPRTLSSLKQPPLEVSTISEQPMTNIGIPVAATVIAPLPRVSIPSMEDMPLTPPADIENLSKHPLQLEELKQPEEEWVDYWTWLKHRTFQPPPTIIRMKQILLNHPRQLT
ncbi:hypothetical protein [Candidatus Odyssella acanthamoebae]|uniref:Uncharacterized protein n=1 Tax=Candidatus Odyssella acanthamoebae TaxID=91604 RepID=A0A077AVH4_9PROT|nr:hypothetical protein [Candidatus Paracaedibacter acanthamoebae]AIK96039.1 hypothetical protein ID47_03710 [Candidatus Paracaedibacter acanthamoebae]